MEKKKSFLKVDFSKAVEPEEQKKLQKICNHLAIDILDISLVDGNYGNRKSTLIAGMCEICGYTETIEL